MTIFRFSTDDFLEQERIAAWREIFGQKIAKLDMEPPLGHLFRGEVAVKELPSLRIGQISTTSNKITRTPDLIADGSDDIMLGIMLSGEAAVTQQGSGEVRIGPGEAVVWSNSSAGHSHYPAPIEFVSVSIPRNVLVPNLVHPDRAGLRVISAGSQTLRLLSGYLQLLLREDIPEHLGTLTATHVHDLVAAALGPNMEAHDAASRRGLRAARLQAAKADIEANLAHRDLTIDTVARRQGISPRSLRDLFAADNTTFTEYVLNRRLLRVHRKLTDERYAGRAISVLALECGFGDISYFNNSFRRQFGMTPSDARAAAQSGGAKP